MLFICRDAGTRNDQVLFQESPFLVAAKFERNSSISQLPNGVADLAFVARVGRCHSRAARGAKESRGNASPCQAHGQHSLPSQIRSARHSVFPTSLEIGRAHV